MFRNFWYYFLEAIISIRRSGIMMLLAIMTITVSLIIFGFFLLVLANVNNFTNFINSKLEIRLYLKESITKKEIEDFKSRVSGMAAVKKIVFVDRNQAWDKFKDSFKNVDLADMIEKNPLPHSFRVYLKDNQQIPKLKKYFITSYSSYIEDIGEMRNFSDRFLVISKFIKLGGLVLVVLLTLATLLIIINTIRLTVIARQDEILIMQLVGATNSFIRFPFIIEGIIMGLVSSLFSIVILKTGYIFLGIRFQESLPFFPLVYSNSVLNSIYLVVLLFGVFLGFIGAYISVSKSLKISM